VPRANGSKGAAREGGGFGPAGLAGGPSLTGTALSSHVVRSKLRLGNLQVRAPASKVVRAPASKVVQTEVRAPARACKRNGSKGVQAQRSAAARGQSQGQMAPRAGAAADARVTLEPFAGLAALAAAALPGRQRLPHAPRAPGRPRQALPLPALGANFPRLRPWNRCLNCSRILDVSGLRPAPRA